MAHVAVAQVARHRKEVLGYDRRLRGYFLYKGRLFLLETPFVNIELRRVGSPPDQVLYDEVEAHLKRFNNWLNLLSPLAFARYIFTPFNPPAELLEKHEHSRP